MRQACGPSDLRDSYDLPSRVRVVIAGQVKHIRTTVVGPTSISGWERHIRIKKYKKCPFYFLVVRRSACTVVFYGCF